MGCCELDFDINSIELFAIAEPFREQIKSIAIETGIDEKITQSIADELSQRMHNNSIGLAPPITKVPAWLKSIALTALAGKPIIGAGIEIYNRRIINKKNIQHTQAVQIEKTKYFMNGESEIAKVYEMLKYISDAELEKFIADVRRSKFIRKNIDSVIALLKERKLPDSGLELAEVTRIGVVKIRTGES